MLVSPFTFYRGAAGVMAADLASTPVSGFRAQTCGDRFENAVAEFAEAYAALNEEDFRLLKRAVRDGLIEVREGI
jgi:predicted RNA-binding Zn ribbon-like protein